MDLEQIPGMDECDAITIAFYPRLFMKGDQTIFNGLTRVYRKAFQYLYKSPALQ